MQFNHGCCGMRPCGWQQHIPREHERRLLSRKSSRNDDLSFPIETRILPDRVIARMIEVIINKQAYENDSVPTLYEHPSRKPAE